MDIKVDIGGALKKTAALAKTPEAARKQLQRWGSQTVLMLMQSARDMKKSGSGRKTGQLARAVGMRMDKGEVSTITVGTNVKRQTDVKYAKIQDEGGTIRPKGHPYLAIPLPGVHGRPKDYPNAFFLETKGGSVFLVEEFYKQNKRRLTRDSGGRFERRRGFVGVGGGTFERGGLRMLFLLKDEVYIPATRWFSRPSRMMKSLLPGFMAPKVILDEAAKLAGVGSVK